MGGFSTVHWLIVALTVLVLFGPGKLSGAMGDFGRGVRAFRKGLAEDEGLNPPPMDTPRLSVGEPDQDKLS